LHTIHREREKLAGAIREVGFSCIRCGDCCRGTEEDANLVMIDPAEIEALARETGRKADDFSNPYPEKVQVPGGGSITFEWCLKRTTEGCIFLDGTRCTAYSSRPWICRTFPFMLSGNNLSISPCKGIGKEISPHNAEEIAGLLMARRTAEQEEEGRIRLILSSRSLPVGKDVLIDGTGVRVL
jgi:hypothetical protein